MEDNNKLLQKLKYVPAQDVKCRRSDRPSLAANSLWWCILHISSFVEWALYPTHTHTYDQAANFIPLRRCCPLPSNLTPASLRRRSRRSKRSTFPTNTTTYEIQRNRACVQYVVSIRVLLGFSFSIGCSNPIIKMKKKEKCTTKHTHTLERVCVSIAVESNQRFISSINV